MLRLNIADCPNARRRPPQMRVVPSISRMRRPPSSWATKKWSPVHALVLIWMALWNEHSPFTVVVVDASCVCFPSFQIWKYLVRVARTWSKYIQIEPFTSITRRRAQRARGHLKNFESISKILYQNAYFSFEKFSKFLVSSSWIKCRTFVFGLPKFNYKYSTNKITNNP